MIILDGENAMTLEELARRICNTLTEESDDDFACYNGRCPAADYCRHGHNGMIDWLKRMVE